MGDLNDFSSDLQFKQYKLGMIKTVKNRESSDAITARYLSAL